eukprot:CAMPEP_0202951450 /NCGR_PEP_ID=MMETSP1395-20130829/31239_1 /ASSEMBLY_ACC=CAM_ASM_000871 /TAXON_ID=5961 /ORGANISM="Blepharisma japonicum, Strain Stock R1072" /LENGTH=51 /DNA_ID=CAMNT_0049658665 /DNA_START=365 /DNA_END=520 /DNA_ORIENTATION=+
MSGIGIMAASTYMEDIFIRMEICMKENEMKEKCMEKENSFIMMGHSIWENE